ncbi:unnamed protein product [Nezara viridula]|uniref:Uncharacterized protein n=1 Tax=Nezara viridula TaxID=85310 RepID=A0A9P0MTN1_NEZVI|nr:unnamed protein product [Nezara viridula]
MYLRKNSPYKEYFQKGILLLKETGIINHEDKIRNRRNKKCLGMVKYIEIGLEETSVALEIFLFGLICSTFIFIIELINAKFMSWLIEYRKQN